MKKAVTTFDSVGFLRKAISEAMMRAKDETGRQVYNRQAEQSRIEFKRQAADANERVRRGFSAHQ